MPPLGKLHQNVQQRCDKAKALSTQSEQFPRPDQCSKTRAKGVIDGCAVILRTKHESVRDAFETKETERQRYGISRDPYQPDVIGNSLTLGIMVSIESFMNMGFLNNAYMVATAQAALLTAMLISLTNVIVSACAGFFIGRRLNYGSLAIDSNSSQFRKTRLWAKFTFCIYLVVIAFFLLSIGLVRSQENLSEIAHSLQAYLELLHTPEALLLVLISACMSAISFYKGMRGFADPHLHYGECALAIENAQEDLADYQDEIQETIEDFFDDAAAEIQDHHKSSVKSINRYNTAVSACHEAYRTLSKEINNAQSQLKSEAISMISSFKKSGGKLETDFNLEALCQFDQFTGIILPEFQTLPDISPSTGQLEAERAECLSRLEEVFGAETINLELEELP